MTEHQRSAANLEQVENSMRLVSTELSELDKESRSLASARDDLKVSIKSFSRAQTSLLELTVDVASTAEKLTGGLVVAEPAAEPDCTEISNALKALFTGSHVREVRLEEIASSTADRKSCNKCSGWQGPARRIGTGWFWPWVAYLLRMSAVLEGLGRDSGQANW